MKGPGETSTPAESPIERRNLTRIGESVTGHRAGSGRPHKGLDLFAPAGSPVLAAADGTVLRVVDGSTSARSSGRRAGWFVDILGREGLIYRYLHLGEKPTVRANQPIQAGSQLGTVGTSGIQHARPHVHFEIRRGDYSDTQRDYGEPVDPLTLLPLGNITNGGFRMADTFPQAPGTDPSASYKPAALDLNAPDAKAAIAFLVSKGWAADEVERLLNQHADAETPDRPVEEHLLSLGWSQSDIARLLVGPEKSHLTAEALFRQYAANSAGDQEALLKALVQAGAKNVKPDPALLSGLNVAHLRPENPSSLEQLISQFATLPDVQKKRFLLLLDSQKLDQKASAPNPQGTDAPPKKAGGPQGGNPKSSGSAGDALPVVKSSLDLLSTALKGLLGETKDGKKKSAEGSTKGRPTKTSTDDESDNEDSSSPSEKDPSEKDPDDSSVDLPDRDDETSSPTGPEDPFGSGSESEPD